MLLWGNKLVWDEEPGEGVNAGVAVRPTTPGSKTTTPGADVAGGPTRAPPLAELVGDTTMTPAQRHYVETVIQPLISAIVVGVVKAMPECAAAFCLGWLLDHLNVPQSLSSPIFSWLKIPVQRGLPPAEKVDSPEHARAAAAKIGPQRKFSVAGTGSRQTPPGTPHARSGHSPAGGRRRPPSSPGRRPLSRQQSDELGRSSRAGTANDAGDQTMSQQVQSARASILKQRSDDPGVPDSPRYGALKASASTCSSRRGSCLKPSPPVSRAESLRAGALHGLKPSPPVSRAESLRAGALHGPFHLVARQEEGAAPRNSASPPVQNAGSRHSTISASGTAKVEHRSSQRRSILKSSPCEETPEMCHTRSILKTTELKINEDNEEPNSRASSRARSAADRPMSDSRRASSARKTRFKHFSGVCIKEPLPEVPAGQKMDLLRKIPLFGLLNEEEMNRILALTQVKAYEPEELVLGSPDGHGSPHREVHIIIQGEGRVMQPVQVGTLKTGEFFGEHTMIPQLLSAPPNPTSVAAQVGSGRLVTLSLRHEDIANLGFSHKIRRLGQTQMDQSKKVLRTDTARQMNSQKQVIRSLRERRAQKSDEDRNFIRMAITENIHMMDWLQLSDKQVETIIDIMLLVKVPAGKEVTKKGERGDTFFIVQDGMLEVVLDHDSQVDQTLARRVRCGDSFGELALLYNTPRKATIRALRDCHLWTINRPQFCAVMKLKSEARIKQYQGLIGNVSMLAERLNEEEIEILADTLEEVFFVKDEDVVRQGEHGDTFFMVFEGQCEVRVNDEVKGTIKKGGYFGERALLNREPRAATVRVVTETATLLTLDATSFDLILFQALEDHGKESMTIEDLKSKHPDRKMLQHRSSVELLRGLIEKNLMKKQINQHTDVTLDRLVPVGLLGSGTFGNVTLQRDQETDKVYALKAMSKAYIKQEKLKSMVSNEKKTMQMLDSPFIVHLYRTYVDDSYYYLLLEAALGGELFTVYSCENLYGSEPHAKFYACCCTIGINFLHSKRIIYRDLKMENVLLRSNGYALITDMGCAKVVIGKTYTVCGTADYFAPETLKRIGHNRAVDWWAMGVLLFIMMSGRSPFDADDVMQIYKNINKGFKHDAFPKAFAPHTVEVIKSLCRKKPEERLGMGPGGIKEFIEHPFFGDLSWEQVEKFEWKVPWTPPDVDLEEISKRPVPNMERKTEVWTDAGGEDSESDMDF